MRDSVHKREPAPIRVQIDTVEYEIPFDRFWERASTDTWVLMVDSHPKGELIVFGLAFLNSYYTAFDLRRN